MAQRQFRSDDTSKWTLGFGNGSDGAYAPETGTDAPIDSACTGTTGEYTLSATNASFAAGQLILIHQTQKASGAGAWELNKIIGYTAGTITLYYPLMNTYASGAQVLVMKQYSSALIDTGVTLTVKPYNGTVGGITGWFCNGVTSIVGSISCTGASGDNIQGSQPSGGGFRGASGVGQHEQGIQGDSQIGNGGASTAANGMGGGGGNWGSNGKAGGGGGGYATVGTAGTPTGDGTGGSAGGTAGGASLTTLLFGGAGGSGGPGDNSTSGQGGNGGGILFVVSKTITVTGSLVSAGGTGGSGGGGGGASGGGGAGGSILLKGKTLTLGSGLVLAGAGAGGINAGSGGVGRIHADYSISLTGSTTPTIDSTNDATIRETFSPPAFFM